MWSDPVKKGFWSFLWNKTVAGKGKKREQIFISNRSAPCRLCTLFKLTGRKIEVMESTSVSASWKGATAPSLKVFLTDFSTGKFAGDSRRKQHTVCWAFSKSFTISLHRCALSSIQNCAPSHGRGMLRGDTWAPGAQGQSVQGREAPY